MVSWLRHDSFGVLLALALCLISALGASAVQTAGGAVTVKDLRWETSSGRLLNALLFTPASASADDPAPGVVVAHGWWNNREMQTANYVELSRRGYVVISVDLYGHGNSDPLPQNDLETNGTGMYDAVQLMADLPYVDEERIGVSGHSNGARAANFSVAVDDAADRQLISSVFLVDNEAFYSDDDGAYQNYYGDRDVGLIADQFDEFFFRSYDEGGVALTTPQEFIGTPDAQSFLSFGADPADAEPRVAEQYYAETIDGDDVLRVLHTPPRTHPWATISSTAVADQIEFFEQSLGAPTPIAGGSQIWQVKEMFTALGLVGFGMFLVAFARLLARTRVFAGANAVIPDRARSSSPRALTWFWGGIAVSVVVSGASYIALSQASWLTPIVFNDVGDGVTTPMGAVFFIGLWAAVNGVAAIAIMTVSYLLWGRRNGLSLRAAGVLPGWRPLGTGVALGAAVVTAAFAIVFVLDYLFTTDFRLWVVAVKWFSPDKLWLGLLYLPLFLIYFIANSIAINAFNRVALFGREWGNTALLALANSLAPVVLVAVQYSTFAVTGELVPGFGGIYSIWLFPVILLLAVSAVISRTIYRSTGNPYIGGFINAVVVVLISVSNSLVVV